MKNIGSLIRQRQIRWPRQQMNIIIVRMTKIGMVWHLGILKFEKRRKHWEKGWKKPSKNQGSSKYGIPPKDRPKFAKFAILAIITISYFTRLNINKNDTSRNDSITQFASGCIRQSRPQRSKKWWIYALLLPPSCRREIKSSPSSLWSISRIFNRNQFRSEDRNAIFSRNEFARVQSWSWKITRLDCLSTKIAR